MENKVETIRTFGRFPTLGEMKEYYAREDVLDFLYDECQMRSIEVAFRKKRYPINPTDKPHLKDIIDKTIKEKIECHYKKNADYICLKMLDYLSFHFLTSITSGGKLTGFDMIFETDMQGWRRSFEDLIGAIKVLDDFGVCYRMKYSGVRSLHLMIPFEVLPKQFRGESILNQRAEIWKKIHSYFRRHCGMESAHGGQILRLAYSLNEDNGLVSLPILPDELSSFRPFQTNIHNVVVDKTWHGDIPSGASRNTLKFLREVYSDDVKAKKEKSRTITFGLDIFPRKPSDYNVKSSESAIEKWSARLKSDNEAVRVEAAWHLMMTPETVPISILKQGLADEKTDVRWYLTEALQKTLDSEAIILAARRFWDDDELVRISAIDALVLSGEQAIQIVLNSVPDDIVASMESLYDFSYAIRKIRPGAESEATQSLANLIRDAVLRFLLNAIEHDEYFWLLRGYIRGFRNICYQCDIDETVVSRAAIKLVVPRFLQDVKSEKANYNLYISALQEIRKNLALPLTIIREIAHSFGIDTDGIPSNRMNVEERELIQSLVKSSLSDMSPEQKAQILVSFMIHGKKKLVEPSAVVLLKIGVSETVEAMAYIFEQKSTKLRQFVNLVNILKEIEPSIEKAISERINYMDAWGLIGRHADVDALIEALQNEKEDVREWAIQRLGQVSEKVYHKDIPLKQVTPVLIEALKDESGRVRRHAAHTLGLIGGVNSVPALIEALGDDDKKTCKQAVAAMGEIGQPAVPALITALSDNESELRRANAALALGLIGAPTAVPELIEALQDNHPPVRFNSARALRTIKDTAAVPSLIKMLRDEIKWVRRGAAEALRNIGTTEAMKAVEKYENN
jgi:HEAT repeat protein